MSRCSRTLPLSLYQGKSAQALRRQETIPGRRRGCRPADPKVSQHSLIAAATKVETYNVTLGAVARPGLDVVRRQSSDRHAADGRDVEAVGQVARLKGTAWRTLVSMSICPIRKHRLEAPHHRVPSCPPPRTQTPPRPAACSRQSTTACRETPDPRPARR